MRIHVFNSSSKWLNVKTRLNAERKRHSLNVKSHVDSSSQQDIDVMLSCEVSTALEALNVRATAESLHCVRKSSMRRTPRYIKSWWLVDFPAWIWCEQVTGRACTPHLILEPKDFWRYSLWIRKFECKSSRKGNSGSSSGSRVHDQQAWLGPGIFMYP